MRFRKLWEPLAILEKQNGISSQNFFFASNINKVMNVLKKLSKSSQCSWLYYYPLCKRQYNYNQDNNGTSKLLLLFWCYCFAFFFNTLKFTKFHNKAKKAAF